MKVREGKGGGGKDFHEYICEQCMLSHSKINAKLHILYTEPYPQFHVTNRTDSIEGGQVVPRPICGSYTM